MDLERKHNQAIREEIGQRLRGLLTPEPTKVPPRLRQLALRLDQQSLGDHDSPPISADMPTPAWLRKLRIFRKP
jgi:hypothetical protein